MSLPHGRPQTEALRPAGAPPRSPSLHTRPGLGSYLSEVDRFALDMRKRFTVTTDCRYIDARVAESVTTAPYIEQPTPASSRPRHRAARARSTISTRNTAMMGPWVPPPTSALAPCQITSAIPVCPTARVRPLHAA